MRQELFNELAEECGFFIADDNEEVTKREVRYMMEYMVQNIVHTMLLNPPKHLYTTYDQAMHRATLDHYIDVITEHYA